jgi:hypothetical protein
MTDIKRIFSAVLVVGMFLMGIVGCAEKPPEKTEIKISTPRGTTVTVEKPAHKPADHNPPPVAP